MIELNSIENREKERKFLKEYKFINLPDENIKNENGNELFKKNTNKNLVFTSAGNNTNFDKLWCKKNKNYDIWVIYYKNDNEIFNKYKNSVDYIEKRKGSKFQNFHYIYNKYKNIIEQYDRFFILDDDILDDDILFDTNDINEMFDISKKYNLWICGPTFKKHPESKISHNITKQNKNTLLRFTNFIEVNVPLFNKYAIQKLMKYYDSKLIGWGIDYLFIWACGKNIKNKYALIDKIGCINPIDAEKNNKRELNNIKNVNDRQKIWQEFKNKYNIKEWEHKEWNRITLNN